MKAGTRAKASQILNRRFLDLGAVDVLLIDNSRSECGYVSGTRASVCNFFSGSMLGRDTVIVRACCKTRIKS